MSLLKNAMSLPEERTKALATLEAQRRGGG